MIIRIMASALLLIMFPLSGAFAEDALCECPKLSCDDKCEIEEAVTFYSEKCPDGVRVRSCSRPTCVKKDPFPKLCVGKPMNNEKPVEDESSRVPAAMPEKIEGKKVGKVDGLKGLAWVMRPGLAEIKLNQGDLVNEKDSVKTGPMSRLEIVFEDANRITLSENSELKISDVKFSEDDTKRDVLLQLLKGKVRSQVNQKYNGADNQFKVSTKSAVAGVRGTDFVVELKEDLQRDERKTTVSTFSGAVELRGLDRADKALVSKGEAADFVQRGLNDDTSDLLSRAYLSQVRKMSAMEQRDLKIETSFLSESGKARDVASLSGGYSGPATCAKPDAQFNQCKWQCMNNPSGEKTCRTDMPEVDCQRSVCKADGQWHDQTRLPASQGHLCDPSKTIVAPCDY